MASGTSYQLLTWPRVPRAAARALGKLAALRKVTVRHAHDALSLGGIPTASWDAFARAAAKVKLPEE